MTERMVDVMDQTGKSRHTYPIALTAHLNPSVVASSLVWDTDYEKAALSAAKTAKLVPDSDFGSLKTSVHQAAGQKTAA
jgi:hypothetical protein